MRRPHQGGGVPHVAVLGCHVEVAAHRDVVVGLDRALQIAQKLAEPGQFGLVVLARDLTAVGDVDAVHADPATRGGQQTRTLVVGRAVEPSDHVLEADAADDGHAVPPSVAVGGRLVPERRERHGREGGVGQLGLLHAQHVGSGVVDPFLDPRARRALSEFTFQVAMRMSGPPVQRPRSRRVGRPRRPAGRPPGAAPPRAGACREPSERHLQVQHLPRHHLAPEPGLVDAPEQGSSPV